MGTPRDYPFVWSTWVSKLLAGEAHCLWAAWFRAHYTYVKPTSNFDFAGWQHEHTMLVHQESARLRDDGWKVFIEQQNSFRLEGRTGVVLAGTPDLVAMRDGTALVIDCKTGKPRKSHDYQVLSYMLSLPHARKVYSSLPMTGQIVYQASSQTVSSERIDQSFRTAFRDIMNIIGGDKAPPRVASSQECWFCDISEDDCDERVETGPPENIRVEDLF